MLDNTSVKPYLARIKKWKIRNMVMLYLEAREKFKNYRRLLKRGTFISFERMREICDILFEIKEDHHLLYKRLIDPRKNKFEKTHKFMPDKIETEFMNNIGLLFHKVMVARELKYLMEHYVEESDTFQKNKDNLEEQLRKISMLFDEGIEILKSLISCNKNNLLLLTLLLENPDMTKKHFGKNAVQLVEQFGNGKGLDDVYFSVGKYYLECGRKDKAKNMLQYALKKNSQHQLAKNLLSELN